MTVETFSQLCARIRREGVGPYFKQRFGKGRGVMASDEALDAAWEAFRQSMRGQAPCHGPRERYALIHAIYAASAIDGDYNAGLEAAAKYIQDDYGYALAAEIRKLKKVTP